MSSLIEKFDSLAINDEKERKDIYGYVFRTKKSKNYFFCKNDFIVIPSFDEKKMILCKLVLQKPEYCFICFKCENLTILENMDNVEDYAKSKNKSCIHKKLCKVIFAENISKNYNISPEINYIEVLQKGKVCISLVHPSQDNKKTRLPGIVVLNSRTTKPKCDTCEGKKCIHVNLYREGANNRENEIEMNTLDELPTRKINSEKSKSVNPMDPSGKVTFLE